MKKLTVSILLFMFSIPVFSQVRSDSEKQEVYFNYKERLQKFFTHIGSQAGESTPFAHVDYDYFCTNGVDTLKGKMEIGEGTIVLGQYIEVLAMEYYLLKQSSQDLSQIKNELYYALLAIQRLDLFGEEFFNGSPESNGFFVRDDVPINFYKFWEDTDNMPFHSSHTTTGFVADTFFTTDTAILCCGTETWLQANKTYPMKFTDHPDYQGETAFTKLIRCSKRCITITVFPL